VILYFFSLLDSGFSPSSYSSPDFKTFSFYLQWSSSLFPSQFFFQFNVKRLVARPGRPSFSLPPLSERAWTSLPAPVTRTQFPSLISKCLPVLSPGVVPNPHTSSLVLWSRVLPLPRFCIQTPLSSPLPFLSKSLVFDKIRLFAAQEFLLGRILPPLPPIGQAFRCFTKFFFVLAEVTPIPAQHSHPLSPYLFWWPSGRTSPRPFHILLPPTRGVTFPGPSDFRSGKRTSPPRLANFLKKKYHFNEFAPSPTHLGGFFWP